MNARRSIVAIPLVLASVALAALLFAQHASWSARRSSLVGVNLPSATFGADKLPGRAGVDYFYPDKVDVDYFVSSGMNVIRLGFLWERLQPALGGPFDPDEMRRLDGAVRAIVRQGASVILDLHNYARYRKQAVGSPAVPDDSFADLWERLATLYAGNSQVIFGLMNEPHDIGAEQWRRAAQAAIDGIRRTGARNRILVGVPQWDSASSFVANGDVWRRIVDPADNFAFEVHQYVDRNGSGTGRECPDELAGLEAIRSVTQWMQRNHHKVFLGEFGASGRKECLAALGHMLELMQQQPDVWLGWTYFAGGRGWAADDILSIQPVSDDDKPQMKLLKRYIR
jgi:endoglucanase